MDQGVNWIKVYAGLPEEATRAVAELANARGVPVAGHVGKVSAQQAVEIKRDDIFPCHGSSRSRWSGGRSG